MFRAAAAVAAHTLLAEQKLTGDDPFCPGYEAASDRLAAPMSAEVGLFAVQAVHHISKVQPLPVLDAVKMERTTAAPSDGVMLALLFGPHHPAAKDRALPNIGREDAFVAA